jgi:hypothetical protein
MSHFTEQECSRRSIVGPMSCGSSLQDDAGDGGTMVEVRTVARMSESRVATPVIHGFQKNSIRWSAGDREITACAGGSNTAHRFKDAPLEASFLCAEDHGSDPFTRTVSSKQLNAQARNRKGG